MFGIGYATATTFARHGAATVVVDRDGGRRGADPRSRARHGGDALVVVADVNVSSTASIRWTGYAYPAYAAAKAGVNQLTRSPALQSRIAVSGSTPSSPG